MILIWVQMKTCMWTVSIQSQTIQYDIFLVNMNQPSWNFEALNVPK